MGILKNNPSKDKNILTENGFKYISSSATGALQNCYERAITLDCSYVMWVAVKTDTSEVYIYVEFACGGEIASYDCQLDNSFDDETHSSMNLTNSSLNVLNTTTICGKANI